MDIFTGLECSFEDILGKSMHTFTEKERRSRWASWILNARKSGNKEVTKAWLDKEGCEDCQHLRGSWCTSMDLPCTVNPVLSFRTGMVGMACMGFYKQQTKE